jgi:hypothetical protein
MPKWRVIVNDRELPARPLVLEAAGVRPNDSTNSHQAVAILERLGFKVIYAGERSGVSADSEATRAGSPETGASIIDRLLAISKEVSERDWAELPSDFAKNIDHYLYGGPKRNR